MDIELPPLFIDMEPLSELMELPGPPMLAPASELLP
jgi:hypothetical protein